jgi:hypothetical protein
VLRRDEEEEEEGRATDEGFSKNQFSFFKLGLGAGVQ